MDVLSLPVACSALRNVTVAHLTASAAFYDGPQAESLSRTFLLMPRLASLKLSDFSQSMCSFLPAGPAPVTVESVTPSADHHAMFDAALVFAKKQTRGGTVPIIEQQSVGDLLININLKMRTETLRYLTWKAARALEAGEGDELALEAKIYCSDAAVQSAIDAINLVGVSTYDKSLPFAGFLNDAMVLPIFDSGNVGIRRRDLQGIFQREDYEPWKASIQ